LYFFNVLEDLDQPGEYYLDRGSGRLYFWPPAECGDTLVSVLADPLVQLVDAAHVRLEGLTLECSRGSAVTITGGTSNLVRACTIRNTGNHGVVVTGGTGHTVDRCTIANTGDSGIRLEGGDRATLTAAGHAATNNHVHHVARWSRSYQPAIGMQGVGQRVAHNLIHDSPHTAIMFGGNEHLVECNEIHSVCLETGDVGAIYLGRDWTQRGNVIRHNYVHDLGGVGLGAMAVYLDDCTSGTTVFGNLFVRAGRAAFIGGGRDNLIENNIFIDCQPAVWVDGRGLSWHKMVYELMAESLAAMKPDQPPYSTRYPALAALRPYYAAKNGVPPEGNRVCRNICRGGQWLEILWGADPKLIDLRDNLVEVDPLFVNAAAGDYRLRRESPAWKLGFRPIPFEQIGPRPGPVAQR
jgi:hypothetical protein